VELSSGLLLGRSSGERKLKVLHWTMQLDYVECKMHLCTVLLKDKIVISDEIIAFNICSDSKISQQYSPLTFTAMLHKNNSATDTVTDLKCDGSRLQDAMLPS